MSDGDAVIVAVRVRPFTEREKLRNAQLVVHMSEDGKSTTLKDPNNNGDELKVFTFDHSYWSYDGFKAENNGYLKPMTTKYADQKKVFDDLGKGLLDNAWKGYNCSLFAYGQTGSGKSYSMVGFNKNKGIVPLVCEELFNRIQQHKQESEEVEYQVTVSMMEIYCENIRDLLSHKPMPKCALKVREHPKTGFYGLVEGLSSFPVTSYQQIERKINEGTLERTIAATNMNSTSSRAHTIVKILFNQKSNSSGGVSTTKSSEINLIDLAGSERQKSAGSEGDRLKEGIINGLKSQVCTFPMATMAELRQRLKRGFMRLPQRMLNSGIEGYQNRLKYCLQVNGKSVEKIPYRDSVLTSLLKNALGGNSKTIMIAAISPADLHYEETLSTLRFADRAKSIKTKAVINESATERMIRELREENTRLQAIINRGKVEDGVATQFLLLLKGCTCCCGGGSLTLPNLRKQWMCTKQNSCQWIQFVKHHFFSPLD